MQLRFDDQIHQLAAVSAVADVFDGQVKLEAENALLFSEGGISSVPNRLDLTESQLLSNLRDVQTDQRLPQDDAIAYIRESVDTESGPAVCQFPNFSVEMETGTGKTYTYLRTALELARRFGLRKYIIVVPSIAIREGVLKTFRMTASHFARVFPELVYRYRTYNAGKLAELSAFSTSGDVEFLVITIDSFNRESNVMRQRPDAMGGLAPIHVVQATRPILILDEPQNMESELRVRALALLNPIFALRYSATHRQPYNVVYRLTPYDAFRLRLVKQIAVASVMSEHDANRPYVKLIETKSRASSVTAKLALQVLTADGSIKERAITVKAGDKLSYLSNRPIYQDYEIARIDHAQQRIEFVNGIELHRGDVSGQDKGAIFDAQITRALEEHFRKQEALKPQGIKVLTLFFIDKVDNYVNNGPIRQLFDKRFNQLKAVHHEWGNREPGQVQASYFARKRRRGGVLELIDSHGQRTKEEDEAAFNLIMRDKEALLSFAEPVAFIFSHSALREGWDNPNVFQIVTLNESVSEVRKRQEIGRGLRLAVNQDGVRVHDSAANVLTVVANESYREYVSQLQSQLDEEGQHTEDRAPLPADADEDRVVQLRQEVVLSEEFRALWSAISKRTQYRVRVNSQSVIQNVAKRLDGIDYRKARVSITTAHLQVSENNTVVAEVVDTTVRASTTVPPLPNLLGLVAHQLEHTTPRMRLTRRSIFEIIVSLSQDTLAAAIANPQEFVTEAGRAIKDVLADELVDGIKYVSTGDSYRQELVDPALDGHLGELVPVRHSVVDKISVDSQTERRFAEAVDSRKDVPLFIKLPSRFVVSTPVGNYNPDWALVVDRQRVLAVGETPVLFLVRETKSTRDLNQLRANEARKIRCGEAHFQGALGVDFAAITSAEELM